MKKKLANPFILGLQGFVVGAILFWATQPSQPEPPAAAPSPALVRQIAGL